MAAPEQSRTTPVGARLQSDPAVVVVGAALSPADIPGLCGCVASLLAAGETAVVVCDVGALGSPDGVALEALARMQLIARRFGGAIALRGVSGALKDLVALCGLTEVLGIEQLVKPVGQAKQREPPGGVQKEGDPGDGPV